MLLPFFKIILKFGKLRNKTYFGQEGFKYGLRGDYQRVNIVSSKDSAPTSSWITKTIAKVLSYAGMSGVIFAANRQCKKTQGSPV